MRPSSGVAPGRDVCGNLAGVARCSSCARVGTMYNPSHRSSAKTQCMLQTRNTTQPESFAPHGRKHTAQAPKPRPCRRAYVCNTHVPERASRCVAAHTCEVAAHGPRICSRLAERHGTATSLSNTFALPGLTKTEALHIARTPWHHTPWMGSLCF